MSHPLILLDVFTETALEGNPLAVVFEADDLDGTRMQAIARELNLSETVFVLTPRDPVNAARIRIFTPVSELPFAGHPTVGAAVILAQRRAPEIIARQDLGVAIEEEIGLVACTVRRRSGATWASFTLPRRPERLADPLDPALAASALGLAVADIGFADHRPCFASAGVRFAVVPVASLDAARRATPDLAAWGRAFPDCGAFLYTRETRDPAADIHARMFAPTLGIAEDPATGSAAAALAAVLVDAEAPEDGDHTLLIEQGVEMGRPSRITLGIEVDGGRLVGGSLGGAAVVVMDGTLAL